MNFGVTEQDNGQENQFFTVRILGLGILERDMVGRGSAEHKVRLKIHARNALFRWRDQITTVKVFTHRNKFGSHGWNISGFGVTILVRKSLENNFTLVHGEGQVHRQLYHLLDTAPLLQLVGTIDTEFEGESPRRKPRFVQVCLVPKRKVRWESQWLVHIAVKSDKVRPYYNVSNLYVHDCQKGHVERRLNHRFNPTLELATIFRLVVNNKVPISV